MKKTLAELDEYQRRMHAEGRCIWCGSKKTRTFGGKNGRTYHSMSCAECYKTQSTFEYDLGPARASINHELQRRLGGPLAPLAEMGVGDDRNQEPGRHADFFGKPEKGK